MSGIRNLLKRIVDDHHVPFFTGAMFIIAGVLSLFDNVIEGVLGFDITLIHGLFFLGGFNLLMSLVFMLVGAKTIEGQIEGPQSDAEPDLDRRVQALEAAVKSLQAPSAP